MGLTQVLGKDILLKLSDDNWTTTYTLVCLTKQGFKGSTPVTKKPTQCGQAVGISANDNTFSFDAVMNTTPTAVSAGVGEASLKKVRSWYNSNTLLKVKRSIGSAGADDYIEASAYLTSLSDELAVEDVMTFSGELTVIGDLDLTP
jgi:hypothetical protein